MAADDYLKQYLVGLGVEVDHAGAKQFEATLKQLTGAAESSTTGIAKQFLKWEGAIVGSFAAVGGAVLGLADKVASADLDLTIYAQKMFLSRDAARHLTAATDILGHSLADIAWNPELAARYAKLDDMLTGIDKHYGESYERSMMRLRDAGFALKTIEYLLGVIGGQVLDKLFGALGGDNWIDKLTGSVQWLADHIGPLSDSIAKYLTPILKDAAHVGRDVWEVMKAIGQAFVQIIGQLNGDEGLKDAPLTLDTFGRALDDLADDAVAFTDAMTSAIKVTLDLIKALSSFVTGHWGQAFKDLGDAAGDTTPGGAAIIGTGALGALLGTVSIGALIKLGLKVGGSFAKGVAEGAAKELAEKGAGEAIGGGASKVPGLFTITGKPIPGAGGGIAAGAEGAAAAEGGMGFGAAFGGAILPAIAIGAPLGYALNKWDKSHYGRDFRRSLGLGEDPTKNRHRLWQAMTGQAVDDIDGGTAAAANPSSITSSNEQEAIRQGAAAAGVDPQLAASVAWRESYGGHMMRDGKLITSKVGAQGMFQLMPQTAANLGVDPTTLSGNVAGGTTLLASLLKKYGTTEEALAAYNWGEKRLDRSEKKYGGFSFEHLPKETREYIRAIEGHMGAAGEQAKIDVQIHIAGTNATTQQIADASARGTEMGIRRSRRRQLSSTQGVYS